MSDLVMVALISASFPAVVAVFAAIASIFGPGWRERQQRRADLEKAASDLRFERANDFVDSLTHLAANMSWDTVTMATTARNRFIATLRAGEGAVVDFSREMLAAVRATPGTGGNDRLEAVNDGAELLFGWLRGDVSGRELQESSVFAKS